MGIFSSRLMRRGVPALVCLGLLSGCSYIRILDPNDQSRLEELKLDREVRSAQAEAEPGPGALKMRIDELASPRLILRSGIAGDRVVVEAFSDLTEIRSAIETKLVGFPTALDRVDIIHGQRTAADELPPVIRSQDPEGWDLMFYELEQWGPANASRQVYQTGRMAAPEAVLGAIRGLLLLREESPVPLARPKYQLAARRGKELVGSLTLDAERRLELELPDGETTTWTLLNESQYSQLAGLFHSVLYDFHFEPSPDEAAEPEPTETGLDLPYGDPTAIIGHGFAELAHEASGTQHSLILEMAMIGRADPMTEPIVVGKPREQSVIAHVVRARSDEAEPWQVEYSAGVTPEEAAGLAREWGLEAAALPDALALLRAQTFHSFLSQVTLAGYGLDPAADWR